MYTHLINAKLSKAVPKLSSQEMGLLLPPPPPFSVCFCVYVCNGYVHPDEREIFREQDVCYFERYSPLSSRLTALTCDST